MVPMADEKSPRSVSRRRGSARLTALDGVKLELLAAVCVLAIAGVGLSRLALPRLWELATLMAVGVVCGVWIALRARAALSRARAEADS